MAEVFLSGNAALARGAIEADVKVVTGYPGTPSSDILDAIDTDAYKEWSVNEKVAFEVALGASIVGVRAMAVMKNNGFNWIMDSLGGAVYTGVNGGLVIVVGDDPGAYFSTSEQDCRGLAGYFNIPCLEPSAPQEALEMGRQAFEISEELEMPVVIRTVPMVAHVVAKVKTREIKKLNRVAVFNRHHKIKYRWNPLAPPWPTARHAMALSTIPKQMEISKNSEFNKLIINKKRNIGVICSGVAFCYVQEAFPEANILKIGFPNLVPEELVEKIFENSSKVFVFEDGDPFLENEIRKINKNIFTRKDKYGDLNVDIVKETVNRF